MEIPTACNFHMGYQPGSADGYNRDFFLRSIAVSDTFDRLTAVFRQVFDDDQIVIRPETTAADIEGWDSINHVNLVLAVEREFRLRLSSSAVAGLKNVGELARLVEAQAPARS
jgi:acyl carrier protein